MQKHLSAALLAIRALAIGALAIGVLGLGAVARADGTTTAVPDEPPLTGEAKEKHEKEVKAILANLHGEKNREIVAGSIQRLGAAPSRAGRDALMAFATGNKNQEFVDKAFDALAQIADKPAVEFLCGKHALKSGNFLVQHSACEALQTAKSPLAVGPLLDVLTAKGTKIEIMGAAAIAAAKSGPTDERVNEMLLKLASDRKDTIRSNAIEAIGFLGTDVALARLKEALTSDKNARVRGSAATGIQNSGRRDLIPVLEKALAAETAFQAKDRIQQAIVYLEKSGS
jgi:HEAT repeat protein